MARQGMGSDDNVLPMNDRFHDQHGRHRTSPPPGEEHSTTWARAMRQHREGHGLTNYVRALIRGERDD